MHKEKVMQVLVQAAIQLLNESETPEEITSRKIASKAGVNVAMINYCFQSKDELLKTAIDQIMQDSAGNIFAASNTNIPPLNRLWNMLWEICELVVKFRRFTKIYIPYLLLQSEIEIPNHILPTIREYYGNKKSEAECRIIAYQLISFLQLIFYRSDSFYRYTGIHLENPSERKVLLETEFKLLFKEGNTDE